MQYNRETLANIHNIIKQDVEDIGLQPHSRKSNLINTKDYDGFFTLRYWRAKDTTFLSVIGKWYNQSNIEISVKDDKMYIGIWFGLNNKDFVRVSNQKDEILNKLNDYPDYEWIDEKGNIPDKPLVEWLCEKTHETVFRKQIKSFDKDIVLREIRRLKEYLEMLL